MWLFPGNLADLLPGQSLRGFTSMVFAIRHNEVWRVFSNLTLVPANSRGEFPRKDKVVILLWHSGSPKLLGIWKIKIFLGSP